MLPPDEAFNVLGNETRLQILQTLGRTEGPLRFSELHDRVEYGDSANFSYHLDKLEGHFMRKDDEGYQLRQAGRRVVEAVLSGAVTEAPVLEPTRIEKPCSYCGTPIVMTYHEEQVRKYCTECSGTYGTERVTGTSSEPAEYGYLGSLDLPPAGFQERSTIDVLAAAYNWSLLEHFAWAGGVCPRCSASVDRSASVCEHHDAADGACTRCGGRYAASVQYRCTNCLADHGGMFVNHLLTDPDLQAFLLAHDVNPLSPPPKRFSASVWLYNEEILDADPFEARFTFTIDGDALTMTVDDDLSVVDATNRPASDSV
jgi:DNA-binding transcriptional ArsR family regulator